VGAKLKDYGGGTYVFHCPGCHTDHPYSVPRWSWNGSLDRPTFIPSLKVYWPTDAAGEGRVCHLFVTDGRIQYCADSWHALKGQTVDMPDWEEEKTMTEEQKPTAASAPADAPSATEVPAESPEPQQAKDDGRPTCYRCGKKMHTGGRTDWVCQTAGCGFSMSNEEFSRRKAAQARKA
jgi:Family of unknown function (DUF6527)